MAGSPRDHPHARDRAAVVSIGPIAARDNTPDTITARSASGTVVALGVRDRRQRFAAVVFKLDGRCGNGRVIRPGAHRRR